MHAMQGLGADLNIIKTASGVNIPLTQAGAVTFVFGDAGTGAAVATVTQTDSRGIHSEIDCNVFTVAGVEGLKGVSYAYVGPDGGRTEEHTSELQSLMSISEGVFSLNKT